MPSLAKKVGEAFRDDKLTSKVARHLLTAHPDDGRRSDVLHPSEIAKVDWCERAVYYRITGVEPEPQPASLVMEMVFEEGHYAHHKWQHWWWDMGILKGTFHCLGCSESWEDQSPQRCPFCHAERPLLQYWEVPLQSDYYGIAGQADGDVEGHGLVEIKTIGPGTVRIEAPNLLAQHTNEQGTNWEQLWRSIRQPFASHRRQGYIYDFLAGRDQITFIYDPKFVTAYPKEFVVKFKKEYIEDILDDCLRVREAVDRGRPPKRPMWAEQTHVSCTRCPYRKHCYDRPHRDAVERAERRPRVDGTARAGTTQAPRVRYAKAADESHRS